jgi:hypothetical protein
MKLRTLYNVIIIATCLAMGIYCAHSFYVDVCNYIIINQEQSHGN